MRKLLACLAFSLGLCAGPAVAGSSFYYGLGVADGNVDLNRNVADKSLGAFSITVGYKLHDFVGLELAAGTASDQVGSMFSEPLVHYQAALLRLGYRWDRVGVYVLGGQASYRVDELLTTQSNDTGVAIGLGLNLFGNETTSLNFHALSIDDGAFASASIGFQYYFGGFR